jgi:hypothetical protein
MSWSIHFIGKRDNIIKALHEHSEKITGESKKEFDSYLPDLANLVSANYNNSFEPTLKLIANGHRSEGMSSLNVTIGYAEGEVV